MLTELPFQLPGKIFRSPMPFSPYSGNNQVWPVYREKEIDVVVILAEQQEYLVHAGRDLPRFYRQKGLEVIHFPVQDFQVPRDREAYRELVEQVREQADAGKNIAVHCMAGIGRTGMVMACLARQVLGYDGSRAIEWVREFIPGALENKEQEEFVIGFDG
jgi:protein-tyrosine phosphatase